METANNNPDERRVRVPAQESIQNTAEGSSQTAVEPAPFRGRSISQLPSGPGTTAMRQAAVLQMQRTHGNSMVMRQLMPEAQRQPESESGREHDLSQVPTHSLVNQSIPALGVQADRGEAEALPLSGWVMRMPEPAIQLAPS